VPEEDTREVVIQEEKLTCDIDDLVSRDTWKLLCSVVLNSWRMVKSGSFDASIYLSHLWSILSTCCHVVLDQPFGVGGKKPCPVFRMSNVRWSILCAIHHLQNEVSVVIYDPKFQRSLHYPWGIDIFVLQPLMIFLGSIQFTIVATPKKKNKRCKAAWNKVCVWRRIGIDGSYRE
jgi:hypothetical protein